MAWIWSQGWIQAGKSFPPARQIAAERGVSLRQVLRAVHQFAAMGFLEVRHGGGIHVLADSVATQPRQESPSLSPPVESVAGLAARIRDSIAEGEFQSGHALPKVAWICAQWHVSTRVLAEACRRLGHEGVLHKLGKNWIVGASAEQSAGLATAPKTFPASILVVSNRSEEWGEFHGNFMDDLVRILGTEADRCSVRLLPVLTGLGEVTPVFASGRKEIRRIALELGDSLMGILLTPLRESFDDFDDWCRWLVRFGKPVVWLQDNHPQLPVIASPLFHRVNFGDWSLPGRETSVELALDTLLAKGHRVLGFACNQASDHDWFRIRAKRLCDGAERRGMVVRVMEAFVTDEKLVATLLLDPEMTVIVAPNDRYARRFWKCLQALGVSVPRHMSMVSFDNLAEMKPFPISTIDFGTSLLGYKVFHLLRRDVPVHVDKDRRLQGKCTLVDNGSILDLKATPSVRRKRR